jgi:peptide/nickel transport system permease protein
MKNDDSSFFSEFAGRFKRDKMAVLGLLGILFFLFLAVLAPLLANSKPLLIFSGGKFSFPALRFFFAPDSNEKMVEKSFNYLLLLLPISFICLKFISAKYRLAIFAVLAIAFLLPFCLLSNRLDRTDWRQKVANEKSFAIFALIPYGPFENISDPYEKPNEKHLLGTDQIGRDITSRMIYGARVSLAVGLAATALTLMIGVSIGLLSGYYGGKLDLAVMRMVEIIICFPTFLLLLILMSIMMDRKFEQSILIVIFVIGLTSWTGLSRIVRGEVLQQRQMPYIRACECLGLPIRRILFLHLLPNVAGPIFVSFTFGVAGAILAESGLSFLGFGVQPPTASWGELLRQAFSDPKTYWHLTLWPGLAIFASVLSFNFVGEGIRKALSPTE